MAFSDVPSDFFGAGYSLSSSMARFNTASAGSDQLLTKLTDAEANATTGSAREIARALCYMLYEQYSDLSVSEVPMQMTINKTITSLPPTPTNPQVLQEQYTFVFNVASDPGAVIDEP